MKTTLCVSNYPQRFEGVVLHPLSLHISRVRGAMSFLPAVCTAPHMTKCNNWVIFSKLLVWICADLQYQRTTKPQRDLELFLLLEESHSLKCDKEIIFLCLRTGELCVPSRLSEMLNTSSFQLFWLLSGCSVVLKTTFKRLKH